MARIWEEQITYRQWSPQGMNGHWYVNEYRELNEHWRSGTYAQVRVASKSAAEKFASALNDAYAAGRMEAVGAVR